MNINTNETEEAIQNYQSIHSNSEDSNIKNYVNKFQKEIEQKFENSKVNSKFRFPKSKKTLKKINPIQHKMDSLESLQGVSYYDLHSKDIRRNLIQNKNEIKQNGKWLAELVKKMGKLNQKYLESQFQNKNSVFYMLLKEAINKNSSQNKQTHIQKQISRNSQTKNVFQINKKVKCKSKNSDKSQHQKSIVSKVHSQKQFIQRKNKNKSQLKRRNTQKEKDTLQTSRSHKKDSFRKTKIEYNKSSIFSKINHKSVKLIKKNHSNESHKKFEKSINNCNKKKGTTTRLKTHQKLQLPLTFTKEQLNTLIRKNFDQINKKTGKNNKN